MPGKQPKNIETFLSDSVVPDVRSKAVEYANGLLERVDSVYNRPYDEAVRLFRNGEVSNREACETVGMPILRESWERVFRWKLEPQISEWCDKELDDYFSDPDYGSLRPETRGVRSYSTR